MISRKIHKDREEIINFYKKYKKVYVYGIGLVSKFIMQYLKEEELPVEAFIVSNGNKTVQDINGKYVYEIDEVVFDDADGIILGVGSKNQEEIKNILIKKNIREEQIYNQKIYMSDVNSCIMHNALLTGKLEDDNAENGLFSKYNSLNELGIKFDTDKSSKFHNYLNKYEFFLKDWKREKFSFLELGVFNGASLKMWEGYFENATIYGVDINPECKQYESVRCKVIIRDLADENNLKELCKLKPSIIVDDASHMWSHQIKSLFHLLETLPHGGIFIMEDLETSFSAYRRFYFADSCISTYEVCSYIARIVCGQEVIKREDVPAVIWDLKEEIEFLASQIEMISFIHGSCIMVKR